MAEIAYLEDGTLHAGGRTGLRRDELERFAVKLRATDHVVLEATGNRGNRTFRAKSGDFA
ncbi:hypothetical protein QZM30_37225 [Burkholderia orbicola]|nr:hypothetical protein [Burkholderia orbicola]MDN7535664.1 hypothetical protein [Burkholderia orbicola]